MTAYSITYLLNILNPKKKSSEKNSLYFGDNIDKYNTDWCIQQS